MQYMCDLCAVQKFKHSRPGLAIGCRASGQSAHAHCLHIAYADCVMLMHLMDLLKTPTTTTTHSPWLISAFNAWPALCFSLQHFCLCLYVHVEVM